MCTGPSHPFVQPSSLCTTYPTGSGNLKSIPGDSGYKAGYTRDMMLGYNSAKLLPHTTDNFEMPFVLQCVPLDRGRKPEETPKALGECNVAVIGMESWRCKANVYALSEHLLNPSHLQCAFLSFYFCNIYIYIYSAF